MGRYLLPVFAVLCLTLLMVDVSSVDASDASLMDDEYEGVRAVRAGPSVAPVLTGICPVEDAIDERRAFCEICPEPAPLDRGRLAVRRVYYGQFVDEETTRAVVALNGCAPTHAEGHATAFLHNSGDQWTLDRYEQGMNTSSCIQVDFGDSHGLICRERILGDRTTNTTVFGLLPHDDGWHVDELDEFFDRSHDCESDGEIVRRLESIHHGNLLDGNAPGVGLLYETRHRSAAAEEPVDCDDYAVETSHHLDIFRPAQNGFERLELDDICAHPERTRILRAVTPEVCGP